MENWIDFSYRDPRTRQKIISVLILPLNDQEAESGKIISDTILQSFRNQMVFALGEGNTETGKGPKKASGYILEPNSRSTRRRWSQKTQV